MRCDVRSHFGSRLALRPALWGGASTRLWPFRLRGCCLIDFIKREKCVSEAGAKRDGACQSGAEVARRERGRGDGACQSGAEVVRKRRVRGREVQRGICWSEKAVWYWT